MKKDIVNKEDIILMVNSFYDKIKNDKLLGNIFIEVMNVNWDSHLVKMYGFWEFIIMKTGNYNGRPFPPHLRVNEKIKLSDDHFKHWLELFNSNIDELFEGVNASETKIKAGNIKEIWSHKLNNINQELLNIKS